VVCKISRFSKFIDPSFRRKEVSHVFWCFPSPVFVLLDCLLFEFGVHHTRLTFAPHSGPGLRSTAILSDWQKAARASLPPASEWLGLKQNRLPSQALATQFRRAAARAECTQNLTIQNRKQQGIRFAWRFAPISGLLLKMRLGEKAICRNGVPPSEKKLFLYRSKTSNDYQKS
jgi:hypothetical protein